MKALGQMIDVYRSDGSCTMDANDAACEDAVRGAGDVSLSTDAHAKLLCSRQDGQAFMVWSYVLILSVVQ
jgi:hypothetical protein